MSFLFLPTDQQFCADVDGASIECSGSGQDGEFGPETASDRFTVSDETVVDTLTGLMWLRDANAPGAPLSWQEASDFIDDLNERAHAGHGDWRLPQRGELFSLISFDTHSPALPEGHPFTNVFQGWYWSATTSAMYESQAWHVHTMGGRMFWGSKDGYELVWPVRDVDPAASARIETGQGARFSVEGDVVTDAATGLRWTRLADLAGGSVDWEGAFGTIRRINEEKAGGIATWRLPSIRELESLTDVTRHSPALSEDHPFVDTREAYWSATNSAYEPNWAMCYYLHKGAVGVGYKRDTGFHVWAVTS